MTESLERFIQAQASTYEHALLELRRGRKEGHWMWFIFPQLRGLGVSENATYYGLRGIDEARDYWQHPLLGPRLERATRAVLDSGVALEKLLGSIDAMKFASCMTLLQRPRASIPCTPRCWVVGCVSTQEHLRYLRSKRKHV
ncbi:DUF1810 family protein [Pseudomonas sp. NA13]